MNPIIEALPNLLGYSVPTVLVIGGMVLFFLPFFKDMQPAQIKSARTYGIAIGVIGIVLVLLIKPREPQPQVVYLLPTPMSISAPSNSTQPTEIPPTPTTLPLLPSTATLEPVTSVIPVWAIEENGVQVNINTSGVYKVEYLGDAYSPWPNKQAEGYQGWTTIVRIYVNRAVEWGRTEYGLIGPINQDDYLSPGGYYLDKNQAISTSAGDSRTFRLNAGEYLIFVTLDEKGRYSDNQGKVDIGITYLGQ